MLLETRCGACGTTGPSPCPDCVRDLRRCRYVPVPPGLDRCEALLVFEGAARDLIARIKYRNQRAALDWLADAMAAIAPGVGDEEADDVEVVTWAPTDRRRRRRRGFDHAELLARRVARHLGLPARHLLYRDGGPALTGLGAEDRRRVAGHQPLRRLDGARVLVVDDVLTTGSTLTAAARALRLAGACSVSGLVAAHTP